MTPEQILWQILCQAGQLFVQSSRSASATAALSTASQGQILEWRIYLLAILLLACVIWIARRLRESEEKRASWEREQEAKMQSHFSSCDKVKKADISDFPTIQLALAKVMALLDKEYPKYGSYLYDQHRNKDDLPE